MAAQEYQAPESVSRLQQRAFIVGGVAGWLASLLVRGAAMGIVGDIIVGIVGAFIGGFVLTLLLPGTVSLTGFNLGSLVVAFIGAAALLAALKLVSGGRL